MRLRTFLLAALILVSFSACKLEQGIYTPPYKPTYWDTDVGFMLELCKNLKRWHFDHNETTEARYYNLALHCLRRELTNRNIPIVGEIKENIMDSLGKDEVEYAFKYLFEKIARLAIKEKISLRDMIIAAADYMLASFNESHTYFINSELFKIIQQRLSGDLGIGIGVRLKKLDDDYYYFTDVYSDNQAYKAGLRRLDRLMLIDGVPSSDDAIEKLRGTKAGTIVELTVRRPSTEEILKIKIKRQAILYPLGDYELLEYMGAKYGYVRIYHFHRKTDEIFQNALNKTLNNKGKGLIIDLRDNPGGYMVALNRSLEVLLKKSELGYIATGDFGKSQFVARYDDEIPDFHLLPLIVLINENSGSAAEILASVVQLAGRGVIVGTTSSGAVGSSMNFDLPFETGMSITVAQIWGRNGEQLEGVGVTPNVLIEMNMNDIKRGYDNQLEQALSILRCGE